MKHLFIILFTVLTACNVSKNNNDNNDKTMSKLPVLTVTEIENGKDGYTAKLTGENKGLYVCTISIPNLEDNYVSLKVGDKVKIDGEYAESHPVQIFAKRILIVK